MGLRREVLQIERGVVMHEQRAQGKYVAWQICGQPTDWCKKELQAGLFPVPDWREEYGQCSSSGNLGLPCPLDSLEQEVDCLRTDGADLI
jgi:hypothetical protein